MDYDQIREYVQIAGEILLYLTLGATIVVRFTKSRADDKVVGKVSNFLSKALSYLPTLGINPKTKQLEEALKEAEAKIPPEKK